MHPVASTAGGAAWLPTSASEAHLLHARGHPDDLQAMWAAEHTIDREPPAIDLNQLLELFLAVRAKWDQLSLLDLHHRGSSGAWSDVNRQGCLICYGEHSGPVPGA